MKSHEFLNIIGNSLLVHGYSSEEVKEGSCDDVLDVWGEIKGESCYVEFTLCTGGDIEGAEVSGIMLYNNYDVEVVILRGEVVSGIDGLVGVLSECFDAPTVPAT